MNESPAGLHFISIPHWLREGTVLNNIPTDEEIAAAAAAYVAAAMDVFRSVHASPETLMRRLDAHHALYAMMQRCPWVGAHYHIIGSASGERIGCLYDGANYRDVLAEEPGASFVLVDPTTCICRTENADEEDEAGQYECHECGSTYHPTSECPNKLPPDRETIPDENEDPR